jgi:hypothetical protein
MALPCATAYICNHGAGQMTESAETAAAAFEASVADLVEFVEAVRDEDWVKVVPIEERTVAVMTYHIAALMPQMSTWFDVRDEVPGTVAEQDVANAREAREHATVTREEVLALIRANAPAVAAAMRAVTPEWMDSIVKFAPAGGMEMPVARMVAMNEVHVSKHLAAIRAAVADPG